MTANPATPPRALVEDGALIGDAFAVDINQPMAWAAGGAPAFAAIDRRSGRGGLMAVACEPGAPPRAAALMALSGWAHNGLLGPLAQGRAAGPRGTPAWFVISPAPPGPSLAASWRPWSEPDLLQFVLRPVAAVLQALAQRRVTHRAIRPDNVFRAGPEAPVVLGAAWAEPPALRQPSVFDPPYSAMCLPAGRGEGSIADDVYALGVLLLALALGRIPLAGMEPAEIVRRKLALGSHAALLGEQRLPPVIADLVRGMLAEDPDHRPPPALLGDPAAARARRVAARPPRRGQRPLELAGGAVWDARSLSFALAGEPDGGARLLRSGIVERWARRSLGDAGLAGRLEDVLRLRGLDGPVDDPHADAVLGMRAIAALDPLAPLCWRGLAIWPDGLGPALAAAVATEPEGGGVTERLQELVACEAAAHWAMQRSDRGDPVGVRLEARQRRMLLQLRGWGGGLPRLRYALNPVLPCGSPILSGHMVVWPADLLPVLDALAARPELRRQLPMDRDLVAFLATRHDGDIQKEVSGLGQAGDAELLARTQTRLLGRLQRSGQALPGLAGWLLEHLAPAIAAWRYRPRREALEKALRDRAAAGDLSGMAALLEDAAGRAADRRGHQAALLAVRRIDAELAGLAAGRPARAETARRLGQEAMLGLAMMALTVAAVAVLLG